MFGYDMAGNPEDRGFSRRKSMDKTNQSTKLAYTMLYSLYVYISD